MIAASCTELTEVETQSWIEIKVHMICLRLVWVNVWPGSFHLWPVLGALEGPACDGG